MLREGNLLNTYFVSGTLHIFVLFPNFNSFDLWHLNSHLTDEMTNASGD